VSEKYDFRPFVETIIPSSMNLSETSSTADKTPPGLSLKSMIKDVKSFSIK